MQVKDAEIESLLEERERLDAALQSIKGQIQLAASPQSRAQEPGASRASLNVPTLRHVWLLLSIRLGPGVTGFPASPNRALQWRALIQAALQDVTVGLHGTQLRLQLHCRLSGSSPNSQGTCQDSVHDLQGPAPGTGGCTGVPHQRGEQQAGPSLQPAQLCHSPGVCGAGGVPACCYNF